MSTAILALGLAICLATFAAATHDAVTAVVLRDGAIDTAQSVGEQVVDACATGDGCTPPASCAAPHCSVCRDHNTLLVVIERTFAPLLLVGLSPVRAFDVVTFSDIDASSFAALPQCGSPRR